MAQFFQFDHVDPFKTDAKRVHEKRMSGKAYSAKSTRDSLQGPADWSVQYDYQGHEAPSTFRHDVRPDDMGWERNEVPIPRSKPKRQTSGGSKDARQSFRPDMNRVESVFDAYVDMYAEEGDEEEFDAAPDGIRPESYATQSTRRTSLIPYGSHAQPAQPWDERGKNGLYGGGGRGADDHETGWVRDYAFGTLAPPVGYEEDLRYDQDDDGTHHFADDDEADRPRSSSDTGQSGSYPVTPTSSHFPMPPTQATAPGPDPISPRRPNPPPAHARTTSTYSTGQPRTPERPARSTSPTRNPPLTPLPHQVPDPSSVRLPVSPLLHSNVQNSTALSSPAQGSPRTQLKRNNSRFKWQGRSKRPPPISNPILPEGFVESLGMKTFTLYPGCKAPTAGDRAATPVPPVPTTPDRPAVPHNYSPHPQNPTSHESSPALRTSPPRSASSSIRRAKRNGFVPPRASNETARLGSLGQTSDFHVTDAMGRLSMSSSFSTQSDPTGPHSTQAPSHHQFFDQIRRERSQQPEEVSANRGVHVKHLSGTIPSLPLRAAPQPYGGDFATRAAPTARSPPEMHVRTHSANYASAARANAERGRGNSMPTVSREDERGTTVHYGAGGASGSSKPFLAEESDVEDSGTASEYSDAGSRRPSTGQGADWSYYQQPQSPFRQDQYRPHHAQHEPQPASRSRPQSGYDRDSHFETLDVALDEYYPPMVTIEPLSVKRTPPLSTSSTLSSSTLHSPSGASPAATTPRPFAHFNRDVAFDSAPKSHLSPVHSRGNRDSSVDPFGPPPMKGFRKPVPEGPAIRGTGFINPFGVKA
ncbi:hypothetical protein JCM10212_001755 [Sporobolomyces blumeae]